MCSLGRARQLLDWTGLQNSLLQRNPHNLLLRLYFHVRTYPNSGRTGRPQSSPDRDYLHHQLLRGRHHPHPGRPLLEESPGGVLRVLLLDLLCVLFSFSHNTTPFHRTDFCDTCSDAHKVRWVSLVVLSLQKLGRFLHPASRPDFSPLCEGHLDPVLGEHNHQLVAGNSNEQAAAGRKHALTLISHFDLLIVVCNHVDNENGCCCELRTSCYSTNLSFHITTVAAQCNSFHITIGKSMPAAPLHVE